MKIYNTKHEIAAIGGTALEITTDDGARFINIRKKVLMTTKNPNIRKIAYGALGLRSKYLARVGTSTSRMFDTYKDADAHLNWFKQ